MKFKVHRVRFIEYTPQAIHCLAFEDVKVKPRLAISRFVQRNVVTTNLEYRCLSDISLFLLLFYEGLTAVLRFGLQKMTGINNW